MQNGSQSLAICETHCALRWSRGTACLLARVRSVIRGEARSAVALNSFPFFFLYWCIQQSCGSLLCPRHQLVQRKQRTFLCQPISVSVLMVLTTFRRHSPVLIRRILAYCAHYTQYVFQGHASGAGIQDRRPEHAFTTRRLCLRNAWPSKQKWRNVVVIVGTVDTCRQRCRECSTSLCSAWCHIRWFVV